MGKFLPWVCWSRGKAWDPLSLFPQRWRWCCSALPPPPWRGRSRWGWQPSKNNIHIIQPVLRIRIRDPVPFWPLDPEWVKNQNPEGGLSRLIGSGFKKGCVLLYGRIVYCMYNLRMEYSRRKLCTIWLCVHQCVMYGTLSTAPTFNFNQCCGSELKVSDPVSDPDPA